MRTLAALSLKATTTASIIAAYLQIAQLKVEAAPSVPTSQASLLDAKQVASHFGVPESWVREQGRLGTIPSTKVGRYVRFKLEDVEAAVVSKKLELSSSRS